MSTVTIVVVGIWNALLLTALAAELFVRPGGHQGCTMTLIASRSSIAR